MPSAVLVLAAFTASLTAGARPAAAEECTSDADCAEGALCGENAQCQVQVTERVEVPPELGDRYVLETRRYWPLFIAGSALFGAAWIGTIAAVGVTAKDHKASAIGQAFVPAAGPVILHATGSAPEDVSDIIIGIGALQGLGLLTAFVGLTVESRMLVPAGEAASEAGEATGSITITPLVGGGVTGLGVGGTF